MRCTKNGFSCCTRILIALAAIGIACGTANAGLTVIGTQYQQDDPMTEYQCIWHDSNYPTQCGSTLTGCNAHVYLKNTGGGSVTISDVTLAGYSLSTVIKMNYDQHNASSIYYYWDYPPSDILNAGEPMWFKADPKVVPAGGVAQVVVRLKRVPVTNPISIGVVYTSGTVATTVAVNSAAPQLANIGFAQDRSSIYLSWRRSGGAGPTTIKMDDVDVTAYCTTVNDANVNYAATILTPSTVPANVSYHVYQGIYSDGSKATASIRTWVNPFIHGGWGGRSSASTIEEAYDSVNDMLNRGYNASIIGWGDDVSWIASSAPGRLWLLDHGYGCISDAIGKFTGTVPWAWFLNDEPDAEEDNVSGTFCGTGKRLPCGASPMGILCMDMIAHGETLRAASPTTITSINLDGTFKPDNYYSWGQAVDLLQADPYYQRRLGDTYFYYTKNIPLYNKATYIYAVSKAMTRAAEPNPTNIALFGCEWKAPNGSIWPFADPDCRRIEAYYALGAGAKGLSYWWWNAGYPSNGLNDWGPEARALWKAIGLYGVEIKTLKSQFVTSHPIDMTLSPSANVWAKALISGTDTIILMAVNDNYYTDANAVFHSTDVANASVVATLPSWMTSSPTAFEVRTSGLYDVTTSLNGSNLTVQLGTLDIAKMVVITTNSNLRAQIQSHYVTNVWPGVCESLPDYCVAQSAPPAISSQPVSTTVGIGETAAFSVTATGSTPLYYQWKKNGTNIGGATSSTLTLEDVDASDAGSYTVYISNAYGNVTSNAATLTIGASDKCIVNADAEAGFTLQGGGYIANNWTEWEAVSGVTVGYDETATVHGGGHAQRIRIWNTGGSNGGCYQRMPATNGAGYTVTTYIYSQSAYVNCYLGVDPSGGTNPASGVTWSSAATAQSWTQKSVTVTAASTYITVYYKVVAPDSNKANGYFDDATPVCQSVTAPSITEQPSDQIVGLGGTANFSVTAEGTPTLTYQWKKNGANVAGATSASLQITDVELADEGDYTCYVANDYGNVTSDAATLTVTTSGSLTNGNFEASTAANPPTGWTTYIQSAKSGNFTIQTGTPPQGSQWQQTQVFNTGAYGGVRQVVVGLVNGTIYTITGSYKTNSVSATASVRYNLSGNTDRANSTALVSRTDTNWSTFSGTVTASGTSLMLFLDGANGIGSNKASGFDNIKVSGIPVITLQPTAKNICAGTNTTFTVAASGAGTLTYQWQKNSVNVNNGGHYSGCTTTTLSITGADTNDAANYRCVVTNADGSANSNQAALTIKTATAITAQPSAQNACTNDSAMFSVTATGDGAITYQWQKNSANLSEAGHYTGVTTATLTVSPADTNDAANYRCVVTAGCGGATSNQAALTIQAATVITTQPTDKSTCAGSNTTFVVAATGQGTLTYQWLKDDIYMSNGGHYSGVTTATLTITGADTNDAAFYACLVTGGCNNATSNEALLTVGGAAVLTNGNFEYSTVGNPPYGWTTYIQSTKSGAFTIQPATPPQGTQWQQTQVFNTGSFGGVRQNVTGLTSGAVYTISGSYKTNSVSATSAVRYNLSGNTDRANSTVLVSKTGTTWTTFSADVTASGASLMLFLDHLNGTASNKATGYDNIKVTCKP